MVDIAEYNRRAWNRQVELEDRWTRPVGAEEIAAARAGDWSVVLTPERPVPRDWFPPLEGLETLCLASAGGQQGPILAAAGARVTVFDNSPKQLDQDRMVAKREGLSMRFVQGDMRQLEAFPDGHFGLIFHPVSNCFIPDTEPLWRECSRVLGVGGALLSGAINPLRFLFDDEAMSRGELIVRHSIPYSDLEHLSAEQRARAVAELYPLTFGHSLESLIAGQIAVGFHITGFYEDRYSAEAEDPLSAHIASFFALRAIKAGDG